MRRRNRWLLSLAACLALTMSIGTTGFAAKTAAKIGNRKYPTVQAAVDAAKKGQTVKVTGNVTAGEPLVIRKSVTIDFGNKKYTYTGTGYAIELKSGSVTLKNAKLTSANLLRAEEKTRLTIKNGSYKGIMLTNWGNMTIQGGTFTGTGSSAGEQVREKALLDNYGTLTIKGGTFKAGKNSTIENRGKLSISGGTFSTSLEAVTGWPTDGLLLDNRGKGGGAVSAAGATATITGGKFTSNSLTVHNCGKLVVKGGTWASNKAGVIVNSEGSITISGGSFKSKGKSSATLIANSDVPKTTIKGGEFTSAGAVLCGNYQSMILASGGTFTSTSAETAVLEAIDGSKISVTGGRLVGKKTYSYYTENGGKVSIGKKVKVQTKYGRKE